MIPMELRLFADHEPVTINFEHVTYYHRAPGTGEEATVVAFIGGSQIIVSGSVGDFNSRLLQLRQQGFKV